MFHKYKTSRFPQSTNKLCFIGNSYALYASWISGESSEVYGQSSHATGETKKYFLFCSKNNFVAIFFFFKQIMFTFQCWTAVPSSLPSKLFSWSTSSCVDLSQATKPLLYKRYKSHVLPTWFKCVYFTVLMF